MYIAIKSLLICCLLSVSGLPAYARSMSVKLDHTELVRLSSDASAVIVGNPSIADVTIHDPKLILVTAKSIGVTNLLILDHKNRKLFSTDISVLPGKTKHLTLIKGRGKQTYSCQPQCVAVLNRGDSSEHFNRVNAQTGILSQQAESTGN